MVQLPSRAKPGGGGLGDRSRPGLEGAVLGGRRASAQWLLKVWGRDGGGGCTTL